MATTEDPACRREGKGGRREGMRSLQTDFPSPNKEWDQCVKKGTLTVGYGMAAGMVAGMIMGMGIPLVWGLGASMLWSIKRCRALMRDGIMTPEKERAKKEEAAKARLERKRSLEEANKKSKESKQKTSPLEEPKKKGGRSLEDSHECCKKLKELLEKQKHKECDLLKTIEKELGKCGVVDETIQDQIGECADTPSDKSIISKALPRSKINFNATITVKRFVPQSPAFRTRITANGTDVCMCMVGKDGNMETCPSCASQLSSKNEVGKPIQLTLLDEDIKKDIDNVEKVNFSEPQNAADENQKDDVQEPSSESETQNLLGNDEDMKNPSELLVLQDVSSTSENQNLEEDGGYEGEPNNASLFIDEHPSRLDEYIEEEVIEIKGDRFEVIIQEVDDDSGNDNEDDDSGIAEPEVTIPEVVEGFAQQLSNLEEEYVEEELGKGEVIFVETYKSESWPFSFSLPSLDKFHKKSTDSAFKWPPLPSSIIVKPRKEPTCTCVDSNNPNDQHENGDPDLQTEPQNFEACTCGHPRDRCKCKAQGDT